MDLKHPESLITNGDAVMAKAIEIVMPRSDHRLCSWHIEQRMVIHLRGEKLRDFRKIIYHAMDVNEFERQWVQFVETHEIRENDLWIWRMYELRFKWSAAYTKGREFLGMKSNQRSESLNSRLHKHLDRLMSLFDLVEHYEFCLLCIRRVQVEHDGRALVSVPFTEIDGDPFVQRAARIFTPTMFRKVRRQIERLAEWEATEVAWYDDDSMRFEVCCNGNRAHLLHVICTFDGSSIVSARCRCQMLECEGIPCCHMFTVLRSLHVDTIPACCVMVRWTMQANSAFPVERVTNTHVWSEQMDRFRGLCNLGNHALFKASKSAVETERVKEFFASILEEDVEDNWSTGETSFGPLPAYFSGANRPSTSRVLNPEKIISKGAPPTNRGLRRFHENLRRR